MKEHNKHLVLLRYAEECYYDRSKKVVREVKILHVSKDEKWIKIQDLEHTWKIDWLEASKVEVLDDLGYKLFVF